MQANSTVGKDPKRKKYFNYKALRETLANDKQRPPRRRSMLDRCFETVSRAFKHVGFCIVCSISLFRAMAPWALAGLELLTMLLIYGLLIPHALLMRRSMAGYHFSFRRSLEDVLLFSLLRVLAVAIAYCVGSGRQCQRPYLVTAGVLAAVGLPYVITKAALLRWPASRGPPVLLLIASAVFSIAHLLTAYSVRDWARKRYRLGLLGFGYPWEEGEEAWLMMGKRAPASPSSRSDMQLSDDVPAVSLADPDSRFIECCGLSVHYKEAFPLEGLRYEQQGIVLVHGFGAGVFAWRHIMQPLAQKCGCRVIAFDRPGFGLTSRPVVGRGAAAKEASPYTLLNQAHLALQLPQSLGLRRVLYAGHGDGSLLAVVASGLAIRRQREVTVSIEGGQAEPPSEASKGSTTHQSAHASFLPLHPSRRSPDASGEMENQVKLRSATHKRRDSLESELVSSRSMPSTALDATYVPAEADSNDFGNFGNVALPGHFGGGHRRRASGASVSEPPTSFVPAASAPLAENTASAGSTPHSHFYPQHHPGGHREGGALHEPLLHGLPRMPGLAEGQEGLRLLLRGSSGTNLGGGADIQGESGLQEDPMGAGREGSLGGTQTGPVSPIGLALLHPLIASENGPSFTRLLGNSRLGRRVLRPLLRSEIGDVSNRRAWHNPSKVTDEVRELYKAPLRVQNWDHALVEVSRQRKELTEQQRAAFLEDVQELPCIIISGLHDKIVAPSKASATAVGVLPQAQLAILPACGHLSHEEAPEALLRSLGAFATSTLAGPSPPPSAR
ncbi:hypothetical protein WJX84_005053 [Apatococcus fuscideae]|uniref:AB hydrolase-1 domain-containing protein n=1 Tax=Apatococcus fuscideae TaxID=2026836 RepID=A0AAW1TGM2_9CHLO